MYYVNGMLLLNQSPTIEEGQTTQWPKEKYTRANNNLQNIHIKLKIK